MRRRQAAVIGVLWLTLAAVGCSPAQQQDAEQPATGPSEAVAKATDAAPNLPVDFVALPEGRSDHGWVPDAHLELLCNPDTHQFILETSPPQYREVDGYPKRHLWDVADLFVEMGAGFRGDKATPDRVAALHGAATT